jgi:single-stranded-DNA-specific exonuclease
VKKENISYFASAVNEFARKVEPAIPVLKLDCKLNPVALSIDLFDALSVLQPFGTGNNVPVFGIFGVKLEKITSVAGGKHLKLSFSKDNASFQAMLFSCSEYDFAYKSGDILDIAVVLDVSVFNGKRCLSIVIKDYRISGINDSDLAEQIACYDDFCVLVPRDYSAIAPTREECAVIYKYVNHGAVSAISVEQKFMNELGLAKVRMIIDVFVELGLMTKTGDNVKTLYINNNGRKVDLENSSILKRARG